MTTLLKETAALYLIVSVHIVSWIVLDLFWLNHPLGPALFAKYSSQVLRKESKIEREVSVAVNMHSLIVSKIDQFLSNPCQVRSELPTKSLERV